MARLKGQTDRAIAIGKSWELLRVRELPDGTVVGVGRLAFTVAIYIRLTRESWERRYCYNDITTCLGAYEDLKTGTDVPEGWIAKRPE